MRRKAIYDLSVRCGILAIVVIWKYDITEAKAYEIKEKLAQRRADNLYKPEIN